MTDKPEPVPGELSQDDKRATLENDRRVREQSTTFASFAEAFADEERGGRYGAVNKTNVIGTQAAPQYPAGPAWCAGDQGLEPPLGVDINEIQPTGEPHELKASVPTPEPLPFSTQGNCDDPAVAPPNNPLIDVERAGLSPFSKGKR